MQRILIIHSDPDVRSSLEDAVRAASAQPVTIEWAASLADGLRRGLGLKPHAVFVELDMERSNVLRVVSELRGPGRLIVGLYNPLLLGGDLTFLRAATRAGAGDYIPIPTSHGEVAAALDGIASRREPAPKEGRLVAFYGQQGGVGATTLAVNAALLVAGSRKAGGTVVLCDAAAPFGSVAAHLGLNPPLDLSDFASDPRGAAALAACLMEEPSSGLKVLAGPRDPLAGGRIAPEDLTRVLIELRRRFDLVVVDTAPAFDLRTLTVMDAADQVFVVTEAVTPTVLGTARLLRLLEGERLTGDRLRVVLNRFNTFEGNLSERAVADLLGRPVDHVVPYDRSFVTAATRGRPVVTARHSSAVAEALARLGEDVLGSLRRLAGAAR